jgi:chloramphenicol-sensitive protein RarD
MANKGVLYGISAYIIWGFFPFFFKALHTIPVLQIVAHRISGAFVFLLVVIFLRQRGGQFFKYFKQPKILLLYSLPAILLAVNWLTYIWGVNSGFVVETSLGYFINPLVNVLLGVVLLREKLRLPQWVSVGLATIGVAYLTILAGGLPWIALMLAFTMGFYGLIVKIAPLRALDSLTLETGILFIPSLVYLFTVNYLAAEPVWQQEPIVLVLIGLAGVVTATPLLLFSSAVRIIPLSTIGLLQYIAPTIQFLLGVYVYKEAFSNVDLIGFCLIWIALIVYSIDSLRFQRSKPLPAPVI